MKFPEIHPKHKKTIYFLILSGLLFLISFIPIRLAITYYQYPVPQAILTLGSWQEREQFTAQFAQVHPSLPIWVSSGIPPQPAREIFQAAGTPMSQVHLDYRATDTVTNFTTLVDTFKQQKIHHLYIITTDFHIPRSQAIAAFVLGSQGIVFTPVGIPSNVPPESTCHILRDVARSILWIFTGHTGARLNPRYDRRVRYFDQIRQ